MRNLRFALVFIAQLGTVANAGCVGHQMWYGALLHDSCEEMSLWASGKDAHIISRVDANGALDVTGIGEH